MNFVMVTLDNEQHDEQELGHETHHYFYQNIVLGEKYINELIEKILDKVRAMEVYSTSDVVTFEELYTSEGLVGGLILINGDPQWDLDVSVCSFED
jgi:hypothetical protein